MENHCPLTMEKVEPLNAEGFLNLHSAINAAAASQDIEDEESVVIDNEEDFPENPMKINQDDQNIAHDCEQDAEKLCGVNYLFDGVDEREDEGGNSKIEDLKTKGETVTLESAVEGEKSGEEITLEVDELKHVVLDKMNGMNHTQMRNYIPVCNNGHEGEQEPNYLPFKKKAMDKKGNVNDKQADREEEKGGGGGDTAKMEADLKSNAVHHYSKQVGEEEEQGGEKTPNIEQNFKTSIDHNGECDSEQDADNSPSCSKGTQNWQSIRIRSCLFTVGSTLFVLLAFAFHVTNAMPTKASEDAADFGNTKEHFLCYHHSTPFFNTSTKTNCKSRCYNEAKENNCQPGFQGFCLPLVTGNGVIAGCINTTGLHLDGKKCLLVTYVEGHNKYKAECHDEKCPNCTNANSLEERMKMCLFQNETSGDSQSIECNPENSSTRSGCVQPTCWIPGLAVVLLLVHVLTSH